MGWPAQTEGTALVVENGAVYACGTALVVENGAVYACGKGDRGQLGLNSRKHQRLPARVGGAEVHGGSPVLTRARERLDTQQGKVMGHAAMC